MNEHTDSTAPEVSFTPEPINDGGPAYPCIAANRGRPHGINLEGMSLRDKFADTAMKAMLGCPSFMNELCRMPGVVSKEDARAELSRLAYRQAEAMIAERSKQDAQP